MAAVGLFRGPAHKLEYANAEFAERAALANVPLIVGAPSRELFTLDDELAPAMDRAYESGHCEYVSLPNGLVTVCPYLEGRQKVGVWTRFVAAPVPLGSSPERQPVAADPTRATA